MWLQECACWSAGDGSPSWWGLGCWTTSQERFLEVWQAQERLSLWDRWVLSVERLWDPSHHLWEGSRLCVWISGNERIRVQREESNRCSGRGWAGLVKRLLVPGQVGKALDASGTTFWPYLQWCTVKVSISLIKFGPYIIAKKKLEVKKKCMQIS